VRQRLDVAIDTVFYRSVPPPPAMPSAVLASAVGQILAVAPASALTGTPLPCQRPGHEPWRISSPTRTPESGTQHFRVSQAQLVMWVCTTLVPIKPSHAPLPPRMVSYYWLVICQG
jgi:hypothetical protein